MSPTKESKALTVLYVEDESIIRRNVEICLSYIFNVKVAKDGKEGIEIFKKNKIDLVISDINMPIKDGVSMIKEIKNIKPEIPCIITTAYDLEIVNNLYSFKYCQYVKKPFDVKVLLKSVMDTLKV